MKLLKLAVIEVVDFFIIKWKTPPGCSKLARPDRSRSLPAACFPFCMFLPFIALHRGQLYPSSLWLHYLNLSLATHTIKVWPAIRKLNIAKKLVSYTPINITSYLLHVIVEIRIASCHTGAKDARKCKCNLRRFYMFMYIIPTFTLTGTIFIV